MAVQFAFQAAFDTRQVVDGAAKGERAMKEFGDGAERAGIKTRAVAGAMAASLSPLISLFGGLSVAVVATKLVSKISEFEQLRARLESVTGSTTAAARAFDMVTKLASKTPFAVQTLADVFARLEAQGITPTERRLISFGNVAAAMGKDITQFAEAVLDAQTGEFERLKEFGIKASAQGDKVALTFKGVTTTVGKNSSEIVSYLQQIGETQFAGAMERQTHTLAGAWSNFGDAVSNTADRIGRSGLGDQLGDILRTVTEWIGSVSDNWDALTSGMWQAMAATVERVGGLITGLLGLMSTAFEGIDAVVGKMSFVPGSASAKEQTSAIAETYREMFESSRSFTADMSSGLRELSDEAMARFTKSLERGADAEDKLTKKGSLAGEEAKRLAKAYEGLGAAHDARVLDLQAQIAAVGRGTLAERQASIAIETRARVAKLGSGATAEMVRQVGMQVTQETELKDSLDAANEALATRKEIAEALSKIEVSKYLSETLSTKGLAAYRQAAEWVEAYADALKKTGGIWTDQTANWIALNLAQKETSQELADQLAIEQGIDATEKRILSNQNSEWAKQRADELRDAEQSARRAAEDFRDWVDAGRMFADSLGRVNSKLGQTVHSVLDVVEAWKAVTDAQTTSQQIQAGMAMGQSVYGLGQSMGVWNAGGGRGSFGAGLSGNYADTGAMVGGVIGTIVGTYFSSPQLGAAIGSAIGGMLGSAVKKGADEGLAQLRESTAGVALLITKSEGGLGGVLREMGASVREGLMSILDQLGAEMTNIPEMSFKVRDDVISVFVGAITRRFKDMDDAVKFAIQEILKQGEFEGLSETMSKVLNNTISETLDQLARDLDFGQWYDRLGLSEVAIAIEDALTAFRARLRKAAELGLDQGPIYGSLASDLDDIRRGILGLSESAEERIRRQSAEYNARVQLEQAEQMLARVGLVAKRAELEAKVEFLRAELGIQEGEFVLDAAGIEHGIDTYNLRKLLLTAEGELTEAFYTAQGTVLGESLDLLQQFFAAMDALEAVNLNIDAIDALLASLALIGDSDIEAAIGRVNIPSGAPGPSGPTPEDLAAQRLVDIAAAMDELFAKTLEVFSTSWQKQLSDIEAWRQEQIAKFDALGIDREDNIFYGIAATADELFRQLGESVLSSLSPTYAAAKQMRELGQSLKFANDNAERLGLTEEQLAQIRTEQEQNFYLDMAENIARRLGDEQLLADLAQARYTLEIASMRTQIELAMANDVITRATYDYLLSILDRLPETVPTGGTGGTSGGGYSDGSPGGNVNATYDLIQDALRRLAGYENQRPGENATARRIRELNEEFANLRSILGNTARVQAAYNTALQAIITEALQPLRDLGRELAFSDLSPFTRMQQFQLAASEYQRVAALAQAGDWNAIEQLPEVARRYLELLGQTAGTAGGGYAAAYRQVMALIAQLTGTSFPMPGTGGGTGTGISHDGAPRGGNATGGASQFAADVRNADVRATGVERRLESQSVTLAEMRDLLRELRDTERARLSEDRRGGSARRVA